MIVVVIILAGWILALGRRLQLEGLARVWLKSENERLTAVNAYLSGRCKDSAAEISNFTDDETSVRFAIEAGYISAFSSHDLKDDPSRRAEALRVALEYYHKHSGAARAGANH